MTGGDRPVTGIVVFAIDVGKLANIGWCRAAGRTKVGTDLVELVALVARELNGGRRVALGFEAPMFIPYVDEPNRLGNQRQGEAGRPWSAAAGATVLAHGAQQVAYVLRGIAQRVRPTVGFDAGALLAGGIDLLLWEAFVSRQGMRNTPDAHMEDAKAAAVEMWRRLQTGRVESDISDTEVFNLMGAAVIRAGLSDDVELLTVPCVVVKP